MSDVLVGTTLLVSFLGGMVALLAPCCISVMLPAYLSTGFRHRGGVLVATIVFGAGVATVILPIGLGAAALSSLFVEQHTTIYLVGGAVMLLAGAASLAGWTPKLPMPSGRGAAGDGFGSAYLLGAFSGIASACCAPVLIGVAVLSGATASFPTALAIGLAYVAGMVAPLAVAGLLWDRHASRTSRVFTARSVTLRLGRWQRRLPLGRLLSGLLMVGMGLLAWVLAFAGPGMSTDGWQVRVSAWLQHIATRTAEALEWMPGWVLVGLLIAGFVMLLRRGLRTRASHRAPPPDPDAAVHYATLEPASADSDSRENP
ncbi:MAG: cytochrome c biogenesis CcdA family protein [Geodermatophilaceae bacterium]